MADTYKLPATKKRVWIAGSVLRASELHRLICPLLLFCWFFSTGALDPTNIAWLQGDLADNYLGWTAFRFGSWHWPLGMSELIAYPHGMPVIATDSNPLVAILLKPFSPLLPHPFQYLGAWYLLSLILAYNIAFGLIRDMTGRQIGSICGAALIAAAPVFLWRHVHNSLTSQWLVLAAFSVFLRANSDRSAITKYSGLHALAIAIHPYFVPMIFPIAGMDLARRTWRRHVGGSGFIGSVSCLMLGLGAIVVSALATAWITGMLELTNIGGQSGLYTMDPLAWFNPMWSSLLLPGWNVGPGQYEGYQYLGLGGILLLGSGVVLWLSRRNERFARAIPWLLPAFVVWYVIALSPTITAFGHVVVTIDAQNWPVVGKAFSTFRSSGRIAWPLTYFMLLFAVCMWLCRGGRFATIVVAAALVIQFVDINPLAQVIRTETEPEGDQLSLAGIGQWRDAVDGASFVYIDKDLVNDQGLLFKVGSAAFPRKIPVNRFYFAQGMTTDAEGRANEHEDAQVASGKGLDSQALYIIGPSTLSTWIGNRPPALNRVAVLDGHLIVPPADQTAAAASKLPFTFATDLPPDISLYQIARNCGTGCSLVLSVRDEATAHLSPEFIRLIDSRGGRIGQLKYRGSYAALLRDGRVVADAISADKEVTVAGKSFGFDIRAVSGGNNASNTSHIFINGFDLSLNKRGINLVELRPDGVSYVGSYDTHAGIE